MKMKKVFYILFASLALMSCGTGKHAESAVDASASYMNLRVGSYNLWRSDLGKGEYQWNLRKDKLARAIADIDFDIFGIQEVDTTIQRELPLLVEKEGGDYSWFVVSPYSEDGAGSKAQGIVYRKSRFEMLESHRFWLSPTPDVMSSGWDEMKFKRGACCAIFRDKVSGMKFFFMMSHMPLGHEANANSAPIIIERAKMYNPENLPSFFAGDLNTREERPASQLFRTWWNDTFLSLPAEMKTGSTGTFNNHGLNLGKMETAPRIDFIYYRGEGIEPLHYTCDGRMDGGIFPSDHCPVYADFRVRPQTSR